MQEGIGRSGYRVIALVFFGLGALGLATTLLTFGAAQWFEWLGYGLVAIALLALLVLSLQVLAVRAAAAPVDRPVVEAAPSLLPAAPENPDPSRDLGVDYSGDAEPQPVAEEEMLPVSYTPPEQPRAPIVVPPRKPQGDTKGWPKRREPTGVTRGEMIKRKREQPEFEAGREPPLVMARTAASAEATGIPDNVSLGKCGNCGVLLLAPKRRPIRLQCPRCERVHTMT